MTMYELWDRASGNRLGAFPTPIEALQIVCEIAEKEGDDSIGNLVLGVEDKAGASMPIMEGAELLKQAKRTRLATAG